MIEEIVRGQNQAILSFQPKGEILVFKNATRPIMVTVLSSVKGFEVTVGDCLRVCQ
jgi:hypothetical protein